MSFIFRKWVQSGTMGSMIRNCDSPVSHFQGNWQMKLCNVAKCKFALRLCYDKWIRIIPKTKWGVDPSQACLPLCSIKSQILTRNSNSILCNSFNKFLNNNIIIIQSRTWTEILFSVSSFWPEMNGWMKRTFEIIFGFLEMQLSCTESVK